MVNVQYSEHYNKRKMYKEMAEVIENHSTDTKLDREVCFFADIFSRLAHFFCVFIWKYTKNVYICNKIKDKLR